MLILETVSRGAMTLISAWRIPGARLQRIVELRNHARVEHPDRSTLLIARTTKQVADVSRAVRAELNARGGIHAEAVTPSGQSTRLEIAAGDKICFQLWRVLAPKRMEIVRVMTRAGPLTIRKVERRVDRDFNGVHSDVTLLLDAGILEQAESGGVEFPYDRVHVEFDMAAV